MVTKKRRTKRTDNGEGRWTEIQYVGSKIDGLWTVYRRDGTKDWEREYVGGRKTGYQRTWNETGLLIDEQWFLNNRLHGSWRRWFANGRLGTHYHFVRGKEEGLQSVWNEQGELIAFGSVSDGVRHGTFIADVLNRGKLKEMTIEYREGELITDLNWSKT